MPQEKTKVYLIGNAHLDPVWLWRWQEGYAEIKATFRSALDRIEQFDDFIFTSACAAYYYWIETNCPEMFEEIKKRVAEGRWSIVGGWWIQPDCNIPSGESFCRHSLYSQRYFLSCFGKAATLGYNVDSFGHNGNLPQILKKSGMDSYVYMRPNAYGEKVYPAPDGVPFFWRGVDGSEVLTYRIPLGYGGKAMLADNFATSERIAKRAGRTEIMQFFGVGNHGGGPTIEAINTIHRAQENPELGVALQISGPQEYFDAALKNQDKNAPIPVLEGDLQHHAVGCYSTHNETKNSNRRAENRLCAAEKCMVTANVLAGLPADTELVKKGWEKVMFNQFHDIMGGCSIREAYIDAREFYGESLTIGAELYNQALQRISWNVDTDRGFGYRSREDWRLWEMGNCGVPIVIYNPLSWPVREPVQLNRSKMAGVTDYNGVPVSFQEVRSSQSNNEDSSNFVFMADLPAMGYATYWGYIQTEKQPEGFVSPLKVTETTLENDLISVELDKYTGFIKSIKNKAEQTEYLAGLGNRLTVMDDSKLDTWGHDIEKIHDEIGIFTNPVFRVLEQGPVRCKVRVRTSYFASEATCDYILYYDRAEIDVELRVFWAEKHKLLKTAFTADVTSPSAVYEIAYGSIVKPADGYEEAGQSFSAVTDGKQGLAIINDGRYSYDCDGATLRMVIVRSPVYADQNSFGNRDDGQTYYQEQGEHFLKYCILPFSGDYRGAGLARRGAELNNPPQYIFETYHKGSLPQRYEGVRVSEPDVILSALKPAEDGRGHIARLYESSGRGARATIELPLLGCSFSADFGPYEIKTFRIENGKATETNIIETE